MAQLASSSHEQVPSALGNPRDPSFPPPLVDPGAIRPGGPPPDGIPSIDRPVFARADTVGWLRETEPVVAVGVAGEARAYPVQILV